jgi:hypothetical protein
MSKSKKEIEAERMYNHYLKNKVYPLIGDKTTYSTQLLGCAKKLFHVLFKGVYPSDKIPKLNDLAPYCILNLDKSNEAGSHWVALAKFPNSDDCMVYDSFGRHYKKILPSLDLSGNGSIKNTDPDIEQKIKETDCGARCIAWLMVYHYHGPDYAILI